MNQIKLSLQNSQYANNLNCIDGVYILLDPKWSKIAVSVSGGADSALLTYLLSKLIVEKKLNIEVNIITNIRMWKSRPWQRKNSIDVFDWMCNNFQEIKYVRHENFIAPEIEYGTAGPVFTDKNGNLKSGDQISVKSHAEYICFRDKIDAWFAGLTKNPNDPSITLGMPDRNQEFDGNVSSLIFENEHTTMCHPFRYHDKKWVMSQYKKHSLNDLLSLTRSCEGDNNSYPEIFKGLDYKNYNDNVTVPKCGKCFWCQERAWGLRNAE